MKKDIKPGDPLPNGAIYIHSIEGERMGVVLGVFANTWTEWVTWEYQTGRPESTSHGNYFKDFVHAVEDFDRRVSEVVT